MVSERRYNLIVSCENGSSRHNADRESIDQFAYPSSQRTIRCPLTGFVLRTIRVRISLRISIMAYVNRIFNFPFIYLHIFIFSFVSQNKGASFAYGTKDAIWNMHLHIAVNSILSQNVWSLNNIFSEQS